MTRRLTDDQAKPVMLAAGVEPTVECPGANAPWPSRCLTCGRDVSPSYSYVRAGDSACAYCSKQRVDPDEAAKAMRSAGVEPLIPYPGTNAAWPCKCTACGRAVSPSYTSVRRGRAACRYCSGHSLDPAEAERKMRAAGLTPLEPYPGPGKWRARCDRCGTEVAPLYATIRRGYRGCPSCAAEELGRVRRRSDDEAAELMRAVGLEPLVGYPGAGSPWPSRCQNCGREVAPRLSSILRGQGPCMWCAGWRVNPDDAVRVMNVAGFEPLAAFPGASKPWRCRCQRCERESTPQYRNIKSGAQKGCRWCARRGAQSPEEWPTS